MEENHNRIEIDGDYPNGFWKKTEYDSNNNRIYYENSKGYWVKYEYDSNNNMIYLESSDGEWFKCDSKGNIIDKGFKDIFPTPDQIKQYIKLVKSGVY